MWFWVWTALVVGALVGAFFMGRRLWRQTVALGRELARAGEVVGQLSERAAELRAIAERDAPDTSPTLFADRGPLHARRAELLVERAARRAARRERRRATIQSWRAYWS